MKWYKHLVDSGDDPDIDDAMTLFGPDGYYVFFRTLEVMSREFRIETPGENLFSIEFFRKKFRISWQKTVKILEFYHERKRIFSSFENDMRMRNIRLKCPKLKELCDEYTNKLLSQKSGQTPDIVGTNSGIEAEGETEEDFAIPSKEEIEEGSAKKLNQQINEIADRLFRGKCFLKVHSFINTMKKQKKNRRAILHTLCRCYVNKPKDPWAYCQKIISKENGNYNAKDHEKTYR